MLQDTIILTVIQHNGQLFRIAVALTLFKAERLFNNIPQLTPGSSRSIDCFPAHAHQLRVAGLPLEGELSLTGAAVKNETKGIYVRLGHRVIVPVDFRCDVLEFLPGPVAFLPGADADLSLGVHADIVRVDSTVEILTSGLLLDLAADIRHNGAEFLPAQLHQSLA